MYTDLNKTLTAIGKCLPAGGGPTTEQLYRMYDLTQRLLSQELAVICGLETYGPNPARQERPTLARQHAAGRNVNGIVTLTLEEPIPAMKRLTEAVEEHWKAMLHAAISEVAQPPRTLPFFEQAFVAIEIITPRGSNNARVWDTSNRAIQVILNNLKGIFFHDDDMEHMAFSVVGRWSEGPGKTVIRIFDFARLQQVWTGILPPDGPGP